MSDTRWMTTTPPPIYDASSVSQSTTILKPYLLLPHLYSLTWLAYPILSLLFVAFRLQISSAAAQDAIANAKGDLQTACKAAEQAASAAASMPRIMAIASNKQFADAVNGSANAARAALVLSLTVMEAIINFIVDIYRSTFLCFLELVVRGGLSILIAAVQELNTFVQTTAGSIRTSIQNDITNANSAIQSAVSAFNKVNPFGDVTVPQFNIPSLDALQNITLPTGFQDALVKLNSTLPTVSDLKDKVEAVLDRPFELVKKDINDTFAGISFNASTLPVPRQNLLSFCGQMDTSVVDDLGKDLLKAAKIGTVIIILLAVILLGLNCLLEWYKWRCLMRHLQYTREAWTSDPTLYHNDGPTPSITLTNHNLLMLQANSAHPLLTRIANTLSQKFRMSPSQHTHTQWFFHYIFHPPALACLLIGVFGLLSVQMQLLAVGPLAARYSHRAASSVSDFSNTITTSVNDSMFNQSAAYATEVNGRVDAIQSRINNGVFGWVNETTTTLNSSVNTFYTDIQNAVSTVFNGTILESPAQEFIRCLIGTKVDAIENALTFLHDNLKVDMPRVNQNVLILSPDTVNEATRPIAAAAIGGGQGDDEGLVGRLVGNYVKALKKEQIMFGIFIALWAFVVLMALAIIFWASYIHPWNEARKKRQWQGQRRDGMDPAEIPPSRQFGNEKGIAMAGTLPDFTPMPSPKYEVSDSNPGFKRGDGTYPDNRSDEESAGSRFISRPMKLMAIGKRSLEKERSAGDGEKNESTLLDRVKRLFWKKSEEPEEPVFDLKPSRPILRIATDRETNSYPVIVPNLPTNANSRDYVPPSAWSISPVAQDDTPKPWAQRIIPTRKFNSPGLSSPRPKRSVLEDVDSGYGGENLMDGPSMKPTPVPVPLHHGFHKNDGSPPPASSPIYPTHYPNPLRPASRVPPVRCGARREHHRRSTSVPQESGKKRTLTNTHGRQSSATLDPFATPFDDEHAAVPYPDKRNSAVTNPFIAI